MRTFYHVYFVCESSGLSELVLPIALVDLPLSMVVDTVLLPIDLVKEKHPNSKPFSERACGHFHI
ncbi:MAG: YceK/YidQ family lipoprotein [Hahellaceae bacterium]|nr:YceK/YidQ family lipoprotein [Hahellaceae bacterium]